jgi:hypothetical protein
MGDSGVHCAGDNGNGSRKVGCGVEDDGLSRLLPRYRSDFGSLGENTVSEQPNG